MKKMLAFIVFSVITLVFFTSCVFIPDKTITGDVKNKEENTVEIDASNSLTESVSETSDADETETIVQDEASAIEIIESLGGKPSEDDEYLDKAEEFAAAVMFAETDVIASFTHGKSEYYTFLENVEFNDYFIYPFVISDEKMAEFDENQIYWSSSNNFIIEFDVAKSSGNGFVEGKNFYYLGIQPYSVEGNLVNCFVPADEAFGAVTEKYSEDFPEYFVSEFCSLYVPYLSEGRNYAESFTFGQSQHLITHLMANSGKYAPYPPYSLYEINEFIDQAFDGNDGFEKEPFNSNEWLYYGNYEGDGNDSKLYGCSFAHGGTTVEHKITNLSSPYGEDRVYTVHVYADYAKFAYAYTVQLDFEFEPDEIPSLEMVRISDVTGNRPAFVSV